MTVTFAGNRLGVVPILRWAEVIPRKLDRIRPSLRALENKADLANSRVFIVIKYELDVAMYRRVLWIVGRTLLGESAVKAVKPLGLIADTGSI